MKFPAAGCEIVLNADGARSMRVEVLDTQFKPLPGLSGPDSGTLDTDGGLDCLVKWPKAGLASLGGKKVRLLVHLEKAGTTEPRLYAVSVKAIGKQP